MSVILLIIIYLAFISLGLPDSLLGSAWPVIHTELNIPVSYMGFISMTISFGTIISSIFSDKLTRKLGTSIVTVTSVFLTVLAMIGFSFSSSFYMLILFAIPYGLGAGAIDAALNNYVAINYSSRSMSWLHSFWGLGTIISPFIMSYSLTHSSWNIGYRIVGFIQLGIALILLLTLPIWKKVNFKREEVTSNEKIGIKEVFKTKGTIFLFIGFFAYCAQEATSMNWASTYLVNYKGIEEETAAMFGSLFFIGMTIGRFISGFISNKLGDRWMVRIGTAIILIGIIFLLIPGVQEITLTGLIIVGLGCAPIYPSIIHSTPLNFGKDKSGSIIGIQMASAYVGSTFMPPLFGILGNKIGFELYPFYLLIFVILMIIMIEITFSLTKKEKIKKQVN